MTSGFNLANCEAEVGYLLRDLGELAKARSPVANKGDRSIITLSYRLPEPRLRGIVYSLQDYDIAIRSFLEQQTTNLETIVRESTELLAAPAGRIASCSPAANDDTVRCRALLETIAQGLAMAGRCRQAFAHSISPVGHDLDNLGGYARAAPNPHRNQYGVPSVMDETLYRLYPPASYGAPATTPPPPKLKKHSADRMITLTDKVLHGQGVISIPRGASYWVEPPTEDFQPPEEFPRGEILGSPRTCNDYGNTYQKPLYAKRKPNVWY